MNRESLELILESLESKWHSWRGLLLFLLITMIGLLFFFDSVDLTKINGVEPIIIFFVLGFCCLFWFFTKVKRVSKNKIGIGVAVSFEEDKKSKELYNDFIISLKKALNQGELFHNFELIPFNNNISKKVDSYAEANRLAKKSGLSLLLYGQTRVRDNRDGKLHIIDLNGLVKHAPIDIQTSENFGKAFSKALKSFKISVQDNVDGCDFAGKHISIVTKYILGIAASLSHDFLYAEQLLIDAEKDLQSNLNAHGEDVLSQEMLAIIKGQIGSLYLFVTSIKKSEYAITQNDDMLEEIQSLLEKQSQYRVGDVSSKYMSAICAFKLRRDIDEAERFLKDIKTPDRNGVWYYNRAFLYAYNDDLDAAYKSYAKAFRMPIEDKTIIAQAERFIGDVLEEEPHKIALHFCLGLINYKEKGDYLSAQKAFLAFLNSPDKSKFPNQIKIVKRWLHEIKTALEK